MIDKFLLDITRQIKEIMILRHLTIATAESCTAGLLAACLTSVDKASNYFAYGFITYSNQAKIDLLNVPKQIIEQFGTVSSQTAQAMAVGAMSKAKSNLGVAITGIAGPSCGIPAIPIGTVWIAIASSINREELISNTYNIQSYLSNFVNNKIINEQVADLDTRQMIRYLSCKKALQIILEHIQ